MKLLLTSNGLSNKKLGRAFVGLLQKDVKKSRVLVIHTAQKPEHMTFVDNVGKEISGNGILLPNISYLNIAKRGYKHDIFDYDAVYICGGNTFFILDKMRKNKLLGALKKYVKSGGLYIGVSAGSIIAGPDISIAGWGSEGDINEINLKNLRGLGITNISIFPHYKDKLKKEVDEFRDETGCCVESLKDGQALQINGKIISKI